MNGQFRSEVAETTAALINEGITDPSAEEIADAHFGKAITAVMLASLREQLPAIRDMLVDEYSMRAHIVNSYYYEHTRHNPPNTLQEAKHCLCVGRGNHAEGIRVPNDSNDLILQATIEHNIKSGAGKTAKNYGEAYKSLLVGELTDEQGREIIERERETFLPLLKIRNLLLNRGAIDGDLFEDQPAQLAA